MLQFRNYENALGEGAKIIGKDMSTGYSTILYSGSTNGVALATLGTVATAGTIVAFWVANTTTAAGTAALIATTGGTLASIFTGTSPFVGSMFGTSPLTSSLSLGDTIQVSSVGNTGTLACYVIFQTQN